MCLRAHIPLCCIFRLSSSAADPDDKTRNHKAKGNGKDQQAAADQGRTGGNHQMGATVSRMV